MITDHERGVLHMTGPMEASKKMEGPSEPLAGPLDARGIGEAIINASNVADETLAIDGERLVLSAPEGAVIINLKKLSEVLAAIHSVAPAGEVDENGGIRWFNPPIPRGSKLYLAPPPTKPEAAPVVALQATLEEFEGYDKHGGIDDALMAARLLAKAVRDTIPDMLAELKYITGFLECQGYGASDTRALAATHSPTSELLAGPLSDIVKAMESARSKAGIWAGKSGGPIWSTFTEIERELRDALALLGPKKFINDDVFLLAASPAKPEAAPVARALKWTPDTIRAELVRRQKIGELIVHETYDDAGLSIEEYVELILSFHPVADTAALDALRDMERADEGLANAYSSTHNDYDKERLACERIGLQKGIKILRAAISHPAAAKGGAK